MINEPLVSVVLPVYKGEKFLPDAIESILNQTYQNFEFLIVNDCSPDNSEEVIKSYNDPRIRLISNKNNLGLVGALNVGIDEAKGEYIARMDQDDISLPNRFKTQVNFMRKHPDIVLCGTYYKTFGDRFETMKFSTDSQEMSLTLHFHSCIGHPTVMFNKAIIDKGNYRYPNVIDTEDWAFWFELIESGEKMMNIDEVHLEYRLEGQSTTEQNKDVRKVQFMNMYERILPTLFSKVENNYIDLHWALMQGDIATYNYREVEDYSKLVTAALVKKGFDKRVIGKFLRLKKRRIFCKLVDQNRFKALSFMLRNNMVSFANIKYFFGTINK